MPAKHPNKTKSLNRKYSLGKRVKVYIECIGWHLLAPVRLVVDSYLRGRKLVLIYRTWGATLGDAFMVTAIVDALFQQKGFRSIVFTKRPMLFLHNPHVVTIWDYNKITKLKRSLLKSLCKFLRGGQVICAGLEVWTIRTPPWGNSWDLSDHRWPYFFSFIHESLSLADWSNCHPRVYFSKEEEEGYSSKYSFLPEKYAVVKASAGLDDRPHKQLRNWSPEKARAVLDNTPYISWVQVGEKGEPVLDRALDLTGQTNLRELFYVVSKAQLVLTIEGFLFHVAAAFDVPSVVVFSWMRTMSDHEYPRMTKIFSDPPPPCAPCFRTDCNVAGKPCTGNIGVGQVVAAIEKQWQDLFIKPSMANLTS